MRMLTEFSVKFLLVGAIFFGSLSHAYSAQSCEGLFSGEDRLNWVSQFALSAQFEPLEVQGATLFIYKDATEKFFLNLAEKENQAVVAAAHFINSRGNILYYMPYAVDVGATEMMFDIPAFDGLEINRRGDLVGRVQIKGTSNVLNYIQIPFHRIGQYSRSEGWGEFLDLRHRFSPKTKDAVIAFFDVDDPSLTTLIFYNLAKHRPLDTKQLARRVRQLSAHYPGIELAFYKDGQPFLNFPNR